MAHKMRKDRNGDKENADNRKHTADEGSHTLMAGTIRANHYTMEVLLPLTPHLQTA
jgi:hypothetical protein